MKEKKMIAKIGQKYKRLFGDKEVVKLEKISDSWIMLLDYNGSHFISPDKLKDYFLVLEPDAHKTMLPSENRNIDDPNRHNVSGDMNKPSTMQEIAFRIMNEKDK